MAVKIKLARYGKIRAPYYRIVVADARTKREGRAIESIGLYHPKEEPSLIQVDSERVQYWLGVGAQPTEPVAAILKVTGDWQRFKGEPAPPPMKVAAPRPDKRLAFEAAAKEGMDLGEATTARKRAGKGRGDAEAPRAAAEQTAQATAEPADTSGVDTMATESPAVAAEAPSGEAPAGAAGAASTDASSAVTAGPADADAEG